MEKEGIWIEEFKVAAFMVDQNRHLSLPMLANLLQEAAGNHANLHQLGFHDMQARQRAWVLNRLKIDYRHPIKWLSTIQIQTWVSEMRGPFSQRHFSIQDENGQELASAFTLWVAIDTTTQRPVRLETRDLPILESHIASCGAADKIEVVGSDLVKDVHRVRLSDLDMLGHVNNVRYLVWALDCLLPEYPDQLPQTLTINYLKETKNGELVKIYEQALEEQNASRLSMRLGSTEAEVCRLEIKF